MFANLCFFILMRLALLLAIPSLARCLPAEAWDSHVHVTDPKYPVIADAAYRPGLHTIAENDVFERGLTRVVVLVQPSVYGTDNSLLLEALGRLDWVLQAYIPMHMLEDLEHVIVNLGVRVVLDHLASPTLPFTHPLPSTPGFKPLTRLLGRNVWIKVSAPYRLTNSTSPYADLDPLIKTLFSIAPDRVVYGSDWPHTRFDGLDIRPWIRHLLRLTAGDARLRRGLFRDNARRLWDGFGPGGGRRTDGFGVGFGILPSAHLAYKTYGSPSNPCIIYPTWTSGLIADNEVLIGEKRALDPKRFFIVVPALFGNGQSSSPSNTTIRPFPDITIRDNVTAQHRLLTEKLDVGHARCVLGWSLGACQTYQWITQFPTFADLAVPFCGSARTSSHCQVFLEGVKATLLVARGPSSAAVGAEEAGTWTEEGARAGLRAAARVYAGWGFSHAWYRERKFEELGFASVEEFLVGFCENLFLSKDVENLMAMVFTWQTADCSAQEPYDGRLDLALSAIRTKTLVLPSQTDMMFPPEDSEAHVRGMGEGVGKCVAFPSIWGHWAGGPGFLNLDVGAFYLYSASP
ncbi:homoserine acetyltransferase family protein [Ophiocordyceps camponoti-floridani]|uniref:Homoserine acetyltransferase family protein n=1 Tax=Ophiocordyceps camponoti-floridani TaxID=2030778 RepID=A0A8H4Q2D9_9HYPO|nr:homoserine acetyltransferase family protein [Ophiocordyceps camponoti-floridani]